MSQFLTNRFLICETLLYVMRALLSQPVFSMFESCASSYASVSKFGYWSNLGKIPSSWGIVDISGKRSYCLLIVILGEILVSNCI